MLAGGRVSKSETGVVALPPTSSGGDCENGTRMRPATLKAALGGRGRLRARRKNPRIQGAQRGNWGLGPGRAAAQKPVGQVFGLMISTSVRPDGCHPWLDLVPNWTLFRGYQKKTGFGFLKPPRTLRTVDM